MKTEIMAAVKFVSTLVEKSSDIDPEKLDKFKRKLSQLLQLRFIDHWHPDCPEKGQGYRCLRVNEITRTEPTIEEAAKYSGISYKDLNLPIELTVWVDPEEVSCRFGESKGSCCTVASFKEGDKENFEEFNFSELELEKPKPKDKVLCDKTAEISNIMTTPNKSSPSKTDKSSPKKKQSPNTNQTLTPPKQGSPSNKKNSPNGAREKKNKNHHNGGGHHRSNRRHHNVPHSPPYFKGHNAMMNLPLSYLNHPQHLPMSAANMMPSYPYYPPTRHAVAGLGRSPSQDWGFAENFGRRRSDVNPPWMGGQRALGRV